MKKIITADGNEACSRTAYQFTELSCIYPITPSSPMAEHLDEWSSKGVKNIFEEPVKVVEMQSEAGAAGMMHGSLQAGVLTTTFTASQGLLLMIPNLYKVAGELLPGVFHIAARSLSTHALSIFGDHQDIYACRGTGVCMLASSSVQDAAYLSGVAHLVAIESSLPMMHFFDGFRTSHELNKIEVLESEDWKSLLNEDALRRFRSRALSIQSPVTRGTNQNDDIYFQATEARNSYYDAVPNIVDNYMKKLNKLAGTDYQPFNYYGGKNARYVIVAMGSVTETIKETLTHLGEEYGLIEVHLYRPFSTTYLKNVIPSSVERIAVLDRTKESGSEGEPLYLDIVSALKDMDIEIVGGRYGLSSKNTTPNQIKAVYDMLEGELKHPFTIGIIDDVTNLSLPVDPNFKISSSDEFLIYGYGSDGMVSCGKSLIKLVGDNTSRYVQGYFQYDSKKSGGVTVGHLRFSDSKIQSTYYVENPKLIVLSKDSYLDEFNMVTTINKDGVFLINTEKTEEELLEFIPDDIKAILKERNVKIYTINAYELARKVGLGSKISTIMEIALLSLVPLLDFELAKKELKKYAYDHFSKKGEDIVKANYDAIDLAGSYLKEIHLKEEEYSISKEKVIGVYQAMVRRLGNELPVSAFQKYPDGTFEAGKTADERRSLSDIVPRWLNENCIQCNQCSFVCPHGVIRPYLLSEEEYQNAPEFIQKKCVKPILKGQEGYFIISVCIENCTGCGLCMNTCPGKMNQKALIPTRIEEERKEQEQETFDYLSKTIKAKEVLPGTVIGTQFKQPKFAFHGACAGCGETAYIKLLTQMFGESLVIANATGCSSIYGGDVPNTPYQVPWASSLFEDNAEYGYGILMGKQVLRKRLFDRVESYLKDHDDEILQAWLEDADNIEKAKIAEEHSSNYPEEIQSLKEHFRKPSVWTIGGDGWAYDIGFSGIDHVLASNDDVNILVLDTQVYSNTGGQTSKATPAGAIASFATSGKKTGKKDLARIALTYPNAYVAQVSLGANMMQLIKAFNEAAAHQGPSIIIAYAPCISHGIKGGMGNSLLSEKQAVACGYFNTFRYVPEKKTFFLDSKNPNFDLYEEFLMNQTRFSNLKKVNPTEAEFLLEKNKEDARLRFTYYESLSKNNIN